MSSLAVSISSKCFLILIATLLADIRNLLIRLNTGTDYKIELKKQIFTHSLQDLTEYLV